MIVFNHGDLPCERIDESPFEPPVVEEEEEGMPFQTTLYPIFTKNGKSINHFKQTGSFWRKQGFFCNNDLYLLPPVQVLIFPPIPSLNFSLEFQETVWSINLYKSTAH